MHGLLKIRKDMKLERFRKEYEKKLLGTDKEDVFNNNQTKVDLYYYNTDIKFILKARLNQISVNLDEEINDTKENIKYQCKGPCDLGKTKTISQIDAVGANFKCAHCPAELHIAPNDNKL